MRTFPVVIVLLLAAFFAGHLFGDRVLAMAGMTDSGPPTEETGPEGPVDLRPPADPDDAPQAGEEPGSSEPETSESVAYRGDVIVRLGQSLGGVMGNGEFKAQGGLIAVPANNAEASCQVTGFNLVYVPRREDPVEVQNVGPRYSEQALQLIRRAKPGDIYYYDNVRVLCEGNEGSHRANTLVFNIR